ncbi:hypothetical protein C8R45DRAFT_1113598 [Mycena sanguinolenta]|nr:hypothetical protein C8R45DRAFT_1113598 [Mycena sanguinolenta]
MVFATRIFSFIAILGISALPGMAQFDFHCFLAGAEFDCSSFITPFCTMISESTFTLGPEDTITQCFNIPSTASECMLTVETTATTSIIPDLLTCVAALTLVSDNCPTGGSGDFTNSTAGIASRFWIDPNTGACAIP